MERTTPAVGARGAGVVSGGGWWAVAMGVGVGAGVLVGGNRVIAQEAQPAQQQTVQPTPEQIAAAEQEAKAKLLLQQGKESWDQKNYERVIRKYRQFAQDFRTSAGPIGPGFLDNRKSLSLGVRANYQSAWSAGIQWTATRGNAVQNLFEDRDFMTFDVSYAF